MPAPLIFIHGSGHTHESFDAQVAAFAGADAVSLPGHPEGRALTTVGGYAVWLGKYVRWKGPDRALVAGNSLGGAIALEWALRYPEQVAGLVLLGTGARLRVADRIFEMIDDDWPACIETLAGYSLGPAATPELRARVVSWHHTVGRDATRADYAACNAFDVMDRVGSITAPTLIVVGDRDAMTPPKYATFLRERIAGSTLALIEGAGHLAHAESPDAVNERIRERFGSLLA